MAVHCSSLCESDTKQIGASAWASSTPGSCNRSSNICNFQSQLPLQLSSAAIAIATDLEGARELHSQVVFGRKCCACCHEACESCS